jgi:hypothetical protein
MAKDHRCQRSHFATRGFAAITDSTFDMGRNCTVVIFGWLVLAAARAEPCPANAQKIATYRAGRFVPRASDMAVGAYGDRA